MSDKIDEEETIKLSEDGSVEVKEREQKVICEIHFDSIQNRVYYAGQVVTGCVNLKFNETKTVTAIYAKIVGRGYCKWTTGSSKHRNTHMAEEFYMNKKIYYIGRQNAQERVVIQPGTYKYLFNCEIPDECPTSVEENTGFIRYNVVVVIDEGADKTDTFKEWFTVLNNLNLNHDVTFSYPMSEDIEQRFYTYCLLCCWETEPVKLTIRIPMRGYAPGQEIEITILADNNSNQTLDSFNATIFKKIEFYADSRTKDSENILMTSNCEGCPEGQSVSRKLRITVPPTPRTESSTVCSITYRLMIVAISGCCRDGPSVEFPITIGTYPIDKTNARTNGIVVTQQPTKEILSEKELFQEELETKNTSEATQSQPLLLEGNVHSNTKSVPSTSSAPQPIIDSARFEVAISDLSDKELENTCRPLYPVYRDCVFPLTTDLQVQAIDLNSDV